MLYARCPGYLRSDRTQSDAKIFRVFNKFCPEGAYLMIDVERAGT